jgi:hypothetical protein
VRTVVVIGSPRTGAGELLALDVASGDERTLTVSEVLEAPSRFFAGAGVEHA